MSEELSIKHQGLIYQAQKSILAHGKDVKAILEVLGKLSLDLFNKEGFAVLSYDFAAQMTRPIYKQGFKEETLNHLAEEFTKLKVEKKPIVRNQIVDAEAGKINLIPIGDEEDIYGQIVFVDSESADKAAVNEFIEVATASLGTFLGVGLLQLHLEEMAALIEVSHVVSSTLDLRELLTKIMKTATKVMRCETSTVYLVDEATNELYFSIVQGDSKVGAKLKEIRLPMGTGLAGWCAQNNAPVMVPDTDKDPRFFKGADKKSGFVTRSMICVPMCLKEKVIGVLQVLNRTGDIPFNDHDLETLKAVATQAVSAIENARLYENIQKIYLSTIEVLATAIDAKDPYTRGHSRRVTLYSVAIAEQLGLSPKEIENIRYAGLLHDVGKIGISDSIIRKPGRLTDEEYGIIKTHPAIGARILRPVEFLADKIPGVLHHHEYYDGRGYPDHLSGEDIPLAGRIICVADCFDAM
ncbi:MAG: HD domain-containing protein, partial [Candidatus Riflebacteria bacterium]|nr:HD domain-containing protein [Candidatus Riflebacteria bacterium]